MSGSWCVNAYLVAWKDNRNFWNEIWAVDHEAVFGGIFHYSVAPK
jgi:hypothetical protein